MTSARLPLLAIVGPTASGKSTLAAALGARLGGEVINADSVQVYRHFDIGSGKPNAEERALCPHHLFDLVEPLEPLDAAAWAERAQEVVGDVHARGKLPIVCGGTFLWVRALLYGLANAPKGDEGLRRRHREFVAAHGAAALHARLAEVDPESAARLHENDVLRVSRALEVYELTGRPLSAFHQEHGFRTPRYAHRLAMLDWPRDTYDERVEARVRHMMDAGFVAEVEALQHAGYGEARAMGTVGYKQVASALQRRPLELSVPGAAPDFSPRVGQGRSPATGRADCAGASSSYLRSAQAALAVSAGATDREALIGEIVRATRIFARRQRTWLRDEPVLLIEPAVLTSAEAFERLVQELRLELDQVQPAQAQLTQAQSSASESSSGDGGQDARR